MKTYQSLSAAALLASSVLVSVAPSQLGAADIKESYSQGIQVMKAGEWEKGQKVFTQIVAEHGEKGKEKYGGLFGVVYYNKGYCELKLAAQAKQQGGAENLDKARQYYLQAQESFAKCYEHPSDENGQNIYHVKSLLYKARSEQGAELYDDAAATYKKFLKESQKSDQQNIGLLYGNIAICHFKSSPPKMQEGLKYFETALKNKTSWKTPDAIIVACFQAMTNAVIEQKNERALIDFLNQNRSEITLKPYQMVQFTPFFQKLGDSALKADLQEAAQSLFSLVPDTEVALNELSSLKTTLALYPRPTVRDGADVIRKAQISQWHDDLKAKNKAGDPPEVLNLILMANTYESYGSVRSAYNIYKQLELYYKRSVHREDNLFNLVRTASMVGERDDADRFSQVFLKDFANSPKKEMLDGVNRIQVSNYFDSGNYKKSAEKAQRMVDTLEKPSEEHDFFLYILGGSKYYLGKYNEAKPLLEEHLETYPESDFRVVTSYYEASNLTRLQVWAEAGAKLDALLEAYPDPNENIFLPYALYDRAEVFFAEDQNEQALKNLERIQKEFVGANIEDASYNLRGRIEQSQEEFDKAKASYVKALELSETREHFFIAEESLFNLVNLLVEKNKEAAEANRAEALEYYDKFWEKYPNSAFRAKVAVVGMPALLEVDRFDEGLGHLQAVIADLAKERNPVGLEPAIGSYTKFYLEAREKEGLSKTEAADKLRDHYYNFPGIDSKNIRTLAMLRIAVIGVYEGSLEEAEKQGNQELVSMNKARINAAFEALKKDYPVEKLSDFVLVRVGDYLRKRSNAPRQALAYYEERLKRPQKNGKIKAEFGIADIYGQSDNQEEMDKAIGMMREVIKKSKDSKKTRDEATARIVNIYANKKAWDKVIEEGQAYLKDYRKSRTAIQQLLAQAYEERGTHDKAIATYMSLYGSNTSNPTISILAINRATSLMWDHGKSTDEKSNKQLAYETAARYIKNSRESFEKNKVEFAEEVRNGWLEVEKRVQQWEAGGQVKTLAQIEAEENA